jgi:hypothetical protein
MSSNISSGIGEELACDVSASPDADAPGPRVSCLASRVSRRLQSVDPVHDCRYRARPASFGDGRLNGEYGGLWRLATSLNLRPSANAGVWIVTTSFSVE